MHPSNTLSSPSMMAELEDVQSTRSLTQAMSKSLMASASSMLMWLGGVALAAQVTLSEVKWAFSYNIKGWSILLFIGSAILGIVALAMTKNATKRIHHHTLMGDDMDPEFERRLRRTGQVARLLTLPAMLNVVMCFAYVCYLLGANLLNGVLIAVFILSMVAVWLKQS